MMDHKAQAGAVGRHCERCSIVNVVRAFMLPKHRL